MIILILFCVFFFTQVNVEKLRRLSCAELAGPLPTQHYAGQLELTIENLLKVMGAPFLKGAYNLDGR